MNVKAKLFKLLSGISLAAFLMGGTPVMAYAQSNETAEEEQDRVGPIINSAISNGRLTVEAYDESGVQAIFVNNYEFRDVPDGVLSIRLEQFDSGYKEFKLSAVDFWGNESFDYYINNPYFDEDTEDDDNPASQLPVDAAKSGNAKAIAYLTDEKENEEGAQFYSFETASGKTFYLIVEGEDDDKIVHFLSDVTENDLLNTIPDASEVLPKNSAAYDSNLEIEIEKAYEDKKTTEVSKKDTESKAEEKKEKAPLDFSFPEINKTVFVYIGLGIVAAVGIFIAWYLKVYKKKNKDFLDEEDDYEE